MSSTSYPAQIKVPLKNSPGKVLCLEKLTKVNHSFEYMNVKHEAQRILVSGRSNSGKTKLTMELLIPFMLQYIDTVFLSSPSAEAQGLLAQLLKSKKLKKDNYFKEFNEEVIQTIFNRAREMKETKPKERILILLDDQGTENEMNRRGQKGLLAKIIANARHEGLNLINLIQGIKMVTPAMRKNLDDLIFFKTIDKNEADTFIYEFNDFPGQKGLMRDVYNTLFHHPDIKHDFMYIHLHIDRGCACRYFLSGQYEVFVRDEKE